MQILEPGQYVGHILKEQQADGIVASVSAYNQHLFNDNWHCHVNPHISFVLKGGCSEKKKNQYERLPGRITFYKAGEPHQIVHMFQSVHINLEMTEAFLLQAGFAETTFGNTLDKTPDARLLMLGIYRELLADDTFSHTSVHMLLLGFLNRAQCWRDEKQQPDWIKKVYEVMNDRWAETLKLEDLSHVAGVHPVTVSSCFPRYFSCTLGAYMRKLKIERALELLKTPGISLTDVAYACGFFDQSHFIRTFKQLTGFLPAYYQKL
ncbi:MAG TPA: helix-turn-helix transcriptional regulator [Mucilaginibacter sp.]|jgi:AraC family transcriptional regulator